MTKPFPSQRLSPATHLYRAAAATLRGYATKVSAERVAKNLFPEDAVTPLVLKAATEPAKIGVLSWAGELARQAVEDAIMTSTTLSAAAGLFARGMRVDFAGAGSIRVPGRLVDESDAGAWIGEEQLIPVRPQRMTAGPVLQPRKLAVISSYTSEMVQSSNIEAVSRALIQEATALKLDATLFGTQPDDGTTPGGILNGITPITGTAGGGLNAMASDIGKLIVALAQAGAGAAPVIACNPMQGMALKVAVGVKFDVPVLQSSAIPAGTVIMVEPSSFVSAFGPEPEFFVSPYTLLAYDDTAPPDFPTGSHKSLFQTDSTALKMILRAAWGMRAPHVAVVNGATW
jgi:hypothetical protein